MERAVIVSAVRTPIGRVGGALAAVRPDDLAALVVAEAVLRAGIPAAAVEDVVLGCANQAGEDNRNVARMAALIAGLPQETAGVTVNRLCASGLEALAQAARAVRLGEAEVMVAGGVESMTRAPYVMLKPDRPFARGDRQLVDTTLGWRFVNPRLKERYGTDSMGETAENVAERFGVARQRQDRFALESQRRAGEALAAGRFAAETVPVPLPGGGRFEVDEHPRPDTTLERLGALRPAFRADGTVTAGNSSGINDGAAALVVMAEGRALAEGREILATVLGATAVGVEPAVMGLGPIPATRRLVERLGLGVADFRAVELNEAFASQALVCIDQLGLDPERVNAWGGAIALGHPLGATGARLAVTLIHRLREMGGGLGLVTLCVGVGQGMALALEV
jgi:3-oxoadipyl-CoA thiolase